MEIWKNCYGYEDQIQVSNKGRVRSFDRYVTSGQSKRFVKSIIYSLGNDKDGYKLIGIPNNGNQRTERVHRLVLLTFEYNDNHRNLTVNHIDGVKSNNNLENLEWATQKENNDHAIRTGLVKVTTYKHICKLCGTTFINSREDSIFCSDYCSKKSRRVVNRPDKTELYNLLKGKSFTSVGKMYGVSDNAVRKWCRGYDIPDKAKYYRKRYK